MLIFVNMRQSVDFNQISKSSEFSIILISAHSFCSDWDKRSA